MEVWGTPVRGAVVQVPGRLEVIGAEDGFMREPYLSVRRRSSSEKADALIKGSRDWQKGKLQVLSGKEAPQVETPPWQRSVQSRQVCPRKKVYTPTKQISLCTARTTPEIEEISSEGLGDKKSLCNSAPILRSLGGMHEGEKGNSRRKLTNAQSTVIDNHNTTDQLSESTDDGDDDKDSSSDEYDENEKAPIELMAEFLKAVMDRDYNLSNKLCQMILLYEPDNCEAQHFVPLIKEKLLMEDNDQNSENEDDEEIDEDVSEGSESEESTDGSNTDDSSDETSDSSSDPEEEL